MLHGHCRTRSDNPAKSGLDPRDKHEGDKKECIAPALRRAFLKQSEEIPDQVRDSGTRGYFLPRIALNT